MEHHKADFYLQVSVLDFGFNSSGPLFSTSALFCPDRLAQCLQMYQSGKHRLVYVQLKAWLFTSPKLKLGLSLLTCREKQNCCQYLHLPGKKKTFWKLNLIGSKCIN